MAVETSQRRALSRPVLTVAAVLAFVIAGRLLLAKVWNPFSRGPAARLRESGLTVPADRLDFGEVWEQSHFKWVLPIENPLAQDVAFELAASCKCSAIEPRSLTIPAGQTREVKLTLDLTARASEDHESQRRDFAMSVRPVFDSDKGKVAAAGWTLRGRVRSAIRFERPVIDFGRHSELAQPLRAQKVAITALVPLKSIRAEPQSRDFAVRGNRRTAGDGRFELEIIPAAFPVGPIDARIVVVPELEGGQRLPAKELAITGRILGDIQASPPEALFGAVAVGETVEETVTLSSLTGQRFEVEDMACEGEAVTVKHGPPAGLGLPTFVVKQQVVKSGPQNNRVIFRLRIGSGPSREFIVPVSYLGT